MIGNTAFDAFRGRPVGVWHAVCWISAYRSIFLCAHWLLSLETDAECLVRSLLLQIVYFTASEGAAHNRRSLIDYQVIRAVGWCHAIKYRVCRSAGQPSEQSTSAAPSTSSQKMGTAALRKKIHPFPVGELRREAA